MSLFVLNKDLFIPFQEVKFATFFLIRERIKQKIRHVICAFHIEYIAIEFVDISSWRNKQRAIQLWLWGCVFKVGLIVFFLPSSNLVDELLQVVSAGINTQHWVVVSNRISVLKT